MAEGGVEPIEQVAIGEQIEPQHRGQVRERPAGAREVVEPAQEEHGQERRPDLDAQGVFARSDEGLDLQVLFERLEEQFDLPAVLVDSREGGGGEFEMIGQENDFALILFVPYDDPAQAMRTLRIGFRSRQAHDFVAHDGAAARRIAVFDDPVARVVFHARDEKDALLAPPAEQRVIVVGAVERDDRLLGKPQRIGGEPIVAAGFGNQHVGGQVVVVVEQHMDLHPAFGAPERGPGEKRQTQGDRRGIERKEFVFEAERFLARAELTLRTHAAQDSPEQVLVQGGGAMGVGVGQGGFAGGGAHAEMNQLAQTTGQSRTDLAQRIGAPELTEQHGHKLRPARKTLGVPFGLMLFHDPVEFVTRQMLTNELTEEVGGS